MGHMRLNDVVGEIVGEVIAGRAINKRQAAVNRWDDIDADGQYLAGIDGVVTRIDHACPQSEAQGGAIRGARSRRHCPSSCQLPWPWISRARHLVATRQLSRAGFERAIESAACRSPMTNAPFASGATLCGRPISSGRQTRTGASANASTRSWRKVETPWVRRLRNEPGSYRRPRHDWRSRSA